MARAHAPRRVEGVALDADALAAAADAELAAAGPLRDNAYKIPLARHLIVGHAQGTGGGRVMAGTAPTAIGAPLARIEGRDKVTGAARYAAEYDADDVAYGWIVQSDARPRPDHRARHRRARSPRPAS